MVDLDKLADEVARLIRGRVDLSRVSIMPIIHYVALRYRLTKEEELKLYVLVLKKLEFDSN